MAEQNFEIDGKHQRLFFIARLNVGKPDKGNALEITLQTT